MKAIKFISGLALLASLVAMPLAGCSEAQKTTDAQNAAEAQKTADAKPYPLDTCLVCGMKLGDMGTPFSFVYQGQEIKVCDKSEKAEFDKDPAKYMKKLADAEAKIQK